jgi:NADH-quinone oxidoreductase subunit L
MAANEPGRFAAPVTAICLLLFIGAAGKSAQFPLYVWLPDAMAGPTPVSALIHAATMVTAGVYMVVRTNVLYRLSPEAMVVVALVGAFTAIFAATIGIAQHDIKKVLAYSTVSQLGFMFLAAGVGAFSAAIFHLMTHAFFKACLFLGSGSVIHGMNGEQDMRRMGGLRKYMPFTHWTMLVATLAIAGIPPLAGFFSKDEILAGAFVKRFETLPAPWSHVPLLCWILGIIAATFTAFYMFRLYYMTFWGEYRGARAAGIEASEPSHVGHDLIASHTPLHPEAAPKAPADDHHGGHAALPHESPLSMTLVLVILAILSIIGGFVGPPLGAFGSHHENMFQRWLEPVLEPIGRAPFDFPHAGMALDWALIVASIGVALFGVWLARLFYLSDPTWSRPRAIAARVPWLHRLIENKYYVDEIYHHSVVRGTVLLAEVLNWIDVNIIDGLVNLTRHVTLFLFGHGSNLFDQFVVDGVVNGSAALAKRSSTLLRRAQSGLVQNYALVMGAGVILLVAVYLVTRP